ncbi:MAG TPA: ISAs1 family transposase [Anaerolineae bacterium]|nr:ISAs1 family transposase [Anaerolineae bacterium]
MTTIAPVSTSADLKTYFAALADPRDGNAQLHKLLDIIIAICAVIAGANHWTEVETFGQAKERWLRQFLALPHGIPAHDAFGRVFRYVAPAAFEQCFRQWTQALSEHLGGGSDCL